jgi:hypothetical protein
VLGAEVEPPAEGVDGVGVPGTVADGAPVVTAGDEDCPDAAGAAAPGVAAEPVLSAGVRVDEDFVSADAGDVAEDAALLSGGAFCSAFLHPETKAPASTRPATVAAIGRDFIGSPFTSELRLRRSRRRHGYCTLAARRTGQHSPAERDADDK